MKRIWSLLITLALLAAVLTACGSPKSDSVTQSAGSSAGPRGAYEMSMDMAQPESPAAATAPVPTPREGAPKADPGGPAFAPIPDTSDRKIILNAQFELKVKDGDETVAKISATVRGAGGYVQETRQSGTKQSGRTITMTLRVPSGQYGPITDLIRSSGEVLGQREWTEDVTDQFVDLEARIKSQEIHLEQLQKLYEKGGTIKEMMELENEIARVQADLESMKGRIRVLSNRVDFSTIILSLYEPGAPAPVQPPKTILERISRGFTESLHGVINFTGDLVVFGVSALPILVYLAILVGIPAFLIVRHLGKRGPRQGPPGPPPAFPQ